MKKKLLLCRQRAEEAHNADVRHPSVRSQPTEGGQFCGPHHFGGGAAEDGGHRHHRGADTGPGGVSFFNRIHVNFIHSTVALVHLDWNNGGLKKNGFVSSGLVPNVTKFPISFILNEKLMSKFHFRMLK